MLMLHTAGFACGSFDPIYYRLVREGRQPSFLTAGKAALTAPLLFDHKTPTLWFVCTEFPLTASGKVQKFRLREALAAGSLSRLD